MKRLRHPVAGGLLVSLALSGLVAGYRSGALPLELLDRGERWAQDQLFRFRGPSPPGPETVILAFDDRTMSEDPTLWERRSGWARVVRATSAAGAKVIAVDALFSSPERLLSEPLRSDLASYYRGEPNPAESAERALLDRVWQELQGDAELAAALAEAKNVILGIHLDRDGDADEGGELGKARYGQSLPGGQGVARAGAARASLKELNRPAAALGSLTADEDDTGTVRRLDLGRARGGAVFAPLGVQSLALLLDVPRGKRIFSGDEVRLDERRVALDRGGLWLNFRGEAGTFPTYAVADLVNGRLPPGALQGKIALVGMTAFWHDRVRTPFGQRFPGVEVHATLIDNLLRADPIRRAPWWADAMLTLLLGALVSLVFWPRLISQPALQIAAAAALSGAGLFAVTETFALRNLWLSTLGPSLSASGAMAAGLALSYLGEGLQRRWLRRTFSRYLGEEVIDELIANPQALRLGGERRCLSVLFSDIRGFTTLSEKLSPEQLVAFLNAYLTPMTKAVLARRGMLDKYIGDAVMAVFGAPVPRADHADQALGCVMQMHRELEALAAPLRREFGLVPRIGVGINTGEMVVGNMGSAERFDYTVAGDSVNLASRLEGLTKIYGVFCLVGEGTRRAAGSPFRFREVDLVQVKGKTEPVGLFELLGDADRALAQWSDLEGWQLALAAYRSGDFSQARARFAEFQRKNPQDVVARIYLDRLAALPDSAPAGWSPVFEHTHK